MSRTSFGKRQREKDRQERASAKAERRAERSAEAAPAPAATSPVEEAALLEELAALHARFADGDIDFDAFEAAKADITNRLRVR